MEKYMPDAASVHEEKELVPGGDLRIRGNWWLRKAWRKSKATRVPRETEFRKILRTLIQRHSLCNLVDFFVVEYMVSLAIIYVKPSSQLRPQK